MKLDVGFRRPRGLLLLFLLSSFAKRPPGPGPPVFRFDPMAVNPSSSGAITSRNLDPSCDLVRLAGWLPLFLGLFGAVPGPPKLLLRLNLPFVGVLCAPFIVMEKQRAIDRYSAADIASREINFSLLLLPVKIRRSFCVVQALLKANFFCN